MGSCLYPRRRPQALFNVELPLPVQRRNLAGTEDLIDPILVEGFASREEAMERLSAIAADFATSRRLEQQRKSRSDAQATLKLVGELAESLASKIERTAPETRETLAKRLDLGSCDVEPGLPHVQSIGSAARAFEGAASFLVELGRREGCGGRPPEQAIEDLRECARDFWKRFLSSDCEWPLVWVQQDFPAEPWSTILPRPIYREAEADVPVVDIDAVDRFTSLHLLLELWHDLVAYELLYPLPRRETKAASLTALHLFNSRPHAQVHAANRHPKLSLGCLDRLAELLIGICFV